MNTNTHTTRIRRFTVTLFLTIGLALNCSGAHVNRRIEDTKRTVVVSL